MQSSALEQIEIASFCVGQVKGNQENGTKTETKNVPTISIDKYYHPKLITFLVENFEQWSSLKILLPSCTNLHFVLDEADRMLDIREM